MTIPTKERLEEIRDIQHEDGQYLSHMTPGLQKPYFMIKDLLSEIDALRAEVVRLAKPQPTIWSETFKKLELENSKLSHDIHIQVHARAELALELDRIREKLAVAEDFIRKVASKFYCRETGRYEDDAEEALAEIHNDKPST